MFKSIILSLVLTSAPATFLGSENPVLKLFGNDIVFHCSFDTGDFQADMAGGKASAVMTRGEPVFDKGLFGKAFRNGRPYFEAAGNIDMTLPGTVVLWVSPYQWPTENDGRKEPGFNIFGVSDKDREYELFAGKMGGQPWQKSHLNAYIQYPRQKKHLNCTVWNSGNTNQWKSGEWHMLAVSWNSNSISYSMDGKKPAVTVLPTPIATPGKQFFVGYGDDKLPADRQILTDEVTVFKRILTEEELARLYNETIKAAAKK